MPSSPVTTATTDIHDDERHWLTFQRCWAIADLSLLAVTWRLWTPTSDFPHVPLVNWPLNGTSCQILFVGTSVASLLFIAISERFRRIAYIVLLVGFCGAVMQDQHRLQPWVYQVMLHSVAFVGLSPKSARRWIMAVSISVYFYSACGKFDYQFLHTVGQEFVTSLLLPATSAPTTLRLSLAAGFPLIELIVALGLCIRQTRLAAGVLAILMHVSLAILLGLLGHSAGVILWNVWLMVLAWYLFVTPAEELQQREPNPIATAIAKLGLFAALVLPLCERTGYWDHWLSWSLYSPHTSRVELELHRSVLVAMPTSANPFVLDDIDDDGWHAIAIDRWSLAALGVPIYPQARFQLGVALSIAESLPDANGIRVKVKSVSDRWDGSRSEQWLGGTEELESAANDFWLLPAYAIQAAHPIQTF